MRPLGHDHLCCKPPSLVTKADLMARKKLGTPCKHRTLQRNSTCTLTVSITSQPLRMHGGCVRRARPSLAKSKFGQVWLPSLAKPSLARTKFGQDQVWPNLVTAVCAWALPDAPFALPVAHETISGPSLASTKFGLTSLDQDQLFALKTKIGQDLLRVHQVRYQGHHGCQSRCFCEGVPAEGWRRLHTNTAAGPFISTGLNQHRRPRPAMLNMKVS